ncbi:MAG: DUF4330 family protein [Haloarculaceae archaeon]
MDLLDEKGRLFGAVSVVDVLVVLFVLVGAVYGAMLMFGGGDTRTQFETQYVTLDLGTQPNYIVQQMNEGDVATNSSPGNLTITQLYLAPGGSNVRVMARLAVQVPADTESYHGAPLRIGRELWFRTNRYQVNGTIRDVSGSPDLSVQHTPIVVRGAIPSGFAANIAPGDRIRITDRSVATIDDIAVYDNGNESTQTAFLVINLSTYTSGGTAYFGTTPIRPRQTLTLPIDGYRFQGRVERLDDHLNREQTDVLVTSVVADDESRSISRGDTYRLAGQRLAVVRSVTTYTTEDPNRNRVYVGLSLQTLERDDGTWFGSLPVHQGVTLPIRTQAYRFEGNIVRVGALHQRGTATNRTVTLELNNVRPERADDIRPGMTESSGGDVVARLTDVQQEPATVILTSDSGNIYQGQHPTNLDLRITAQLTVRETTSGLQFRGNSLRLGDTVTLNFGTTSIHATVTNIQQ